VAQIAPFIIPVLDDPLTIKGYFPCPRLLSMYNMTGEMAFAQSRRYRWRLLHSQATP
jgi:hypothetical protein